LNTKEIAKLAGVSRSTVSRVINNYDNVPIETKEKVEKIIKKYGYTPNISAKTLAGHKSDIIELVVSDIDSNKIDKTWAGINSPYNSQIIFSVITECKRKNQLVLINIIEEEQELDNLENNHLNNFIRGGIYIGFNNNDQNIINLYKKKYNIVAIDIFNKESQKQLNVNTVNCLNEEASSNATQYLIDLGHKNIGFIEGDMKLSSIERKNGFINTMNNNHLSILPNAIQSGKFIENNAYIATKNILKNKEITAILCSNDIMAMGAIKAIYENNLKVPDDISIIGFDNNKLKYENNINLTCFYFDSIEIAKKSVDAIFSTGNIQPTCNFKILEGNSVKKIN